MSESYYFVYILLCDNGSYYTGYTTDLTRRYQEHLTGTDKCKFTRSFKPVSLAQSWKIQGSKSIAMKAEKFIKTLSKAKKKQLILSPEKLAEFFPISKTD
jgi:putative endonuclease